MPYTAENLRGCLVETMARFRPNSDAEALLAAVEFVDLDDDPEMPAVQAVADWLAEQRVGRVTVVTPQPLLVDIESADLLIDLDLHPLIRAAIENSPLSDGAFPVRLDAGLIRLGGDVGRPITQAVSRGCGHVPVDVVIADLSADDPQHRAAVRDVAALLKVPLPPAWA